MGLSRTLAVTGVDGFVGRHLAAMAAEQGWRVVGIAQAAAAPALASSLSEYYQADLRHEWPLDGGVDAVIHLAGLAAVGPSFAEPQRYIESNSSMVTTMCEALLAKGQRGTRIVGVSSGGVYAPPAASNPVSEDSPTVESSPYVVSKLLVEHQLAYYSRRGLDTVVVRPFNHVGPGQGPGFLIPDLALAMRDLTGEQPLRAGDLTTERDYTDVRDVARAYLMLAGADSLRSRVYNVASGNARSGHRVLELIAAAMGRSTPAVEIDPSRIRATDPRRITGAADRLRAEFGWQPEISLAKSIADFVGAIG